MKDIDKVKEKVRKLLNQAADREGTPEGQVFYDRAFEIMAMYGFEERDVSAAEESDAMARKTFTFSGAYTEMQAALLFAVATALHCVGFQQKVRRSTKVFAVTLFGRHRHLQRVEMLYVLLNPVMIAGATNLTSCGPFDASTVVKRRSFMQGFARSVGQRLAAAEDGVAGSDERYAVALIDDLRRAEQAQENYARDLGLHLTTSRARRTYDGGAYGSGRDAGDRTDLGQERVQSRPALPW
ncbi:DUF2786 domain-containing protein [Corynebacterium mayonis]|uniref:DUF2786 domain-containing protein n=1 Tax=Corynebacterium mayonis TaxID=3062461 RepID=UPI00313FF672